MRMYKKVCIQLYKMDTYNYTNNYIYTGVIRQYLIIFMFYK